MSVFTEACDAIGDELNRIKSECPVLLQELSTFERYVAVQPRHWLKLRLRTEALRIKILEASLYARHGFKGIVFVGLTKTDFLLTWNKNREMVGSATWHGAQHEQLRLLTVEEGLGILEELETKADSGELWPAIEWLNHHAIRVYDPDGTSIRI